MTLEPRVVERPHARPFSPSGADIALHCTKSVEFTLSGTARPTPHRSAAPGSAAHEAFAVCWHRGIEPSAVPAVWIGQERIELAEQEEAAVAFALAWCRDRFAGRRVAIERLLRLPWGGLFGYADLVALDEPLAVLDLKFGWWPIPASSVQLGTYALMLALEARRSIEGEGSVQAIVMQPRSPDPVRIHDWSHAELRELRDRLIDLYDRIRRRDYSYGAGGWCRWCAAAPVCPALAATARDAALAAVAPPPLVAAGAIDQAKLEAALELAPALEHLARQTRTLAKRYLLAGGRLEQLKLVSKRGGGVTVADRADPRPAVDVAAVLESAGQAMTAARIKSATAK
jgi:hypothetical protein